MKKFTFRAPNPVDKIINFLKYAHLKSSSIRLSENQKKDLSHLREKGYVVFEGIIPSVQLKQLQLIVDNKFRIGDFEFPVLAQNKIDPIKHKKFIDNFLYGGSEELRKKGLVTEKKDFRNYDQFIAENKPSAITLMLPDDDRNFFDLWLNDYILNLVEAYFGFKPSLLEAYIRRNFPSPYRTMNHFWHRDLNNKFFILLIRALDNRHFF